MKAIRRPSAYSFITLAQDCRHAQWPVLTAAVTLYLHPLVAHFLRFWLWLTTAQDPRAWVAIHRKHHACCETADDPHSPQVRGIRKVLWQGAERYRAEAANAETLRRCRSYA